MWDLPTCETSCVEHFPHVSQNPQLQQPAEHCGGVSGAFEVLVLLWFSWVSVWSGCGSGAGLVLWISNRGEDSFISLRFPAVCLNADTGLLQCCVVGGRTDHISST